MDSLRVLKDFLADRPIYAFTLLLLGALVSLWRELKLSEERYRDLALRVLPLADKIQKLIKELNRSRPLPRKEDPS